MTQKSILITGCSSGIGLCVARGLKERGYRVFASARKQTDVERLAEEGFEALQLDLDNSASIERAVRQVLEATGGRLYALFNNGAYGQAGAVEDLSREALKAQFETNIFGTHELTCKLLPAMREQGEGRIIQNGSVLGIIALPYRGAYNATKFALRGLTETLREELKGSGVHASVVEPGPITSRFRANSYLAYKRAIDPAKSYHREYYAKVEQRLQSEEAVVPFTLPPEAVLKQVIRALESPQPKAHYFVTFPTWLFAFLRRLLPYEWLERILLKV